MPIHPLAVASLVLAAAAPLTAQEVDPGAIHRAIQHATSGGFWGAVAVGIDGRIAFERGYGLADYDARPNAPDTLFEIASVSKQFTAAAVLRLHQDGALDVRGTLGEHFANVPADKSGITILQVLRHTSGLSPRVGLPYASPATRDEFLQRVWESEPEREPGAGFEYNNAGYALLAALVEVRSGQTFENYCHGALFAPAGLKDTGFIQDDRVDGARAAVRLHKQEVDGTAHDWHWGWGYRGMGGVVSTVRDLVRWDAALREGTILDNATRAIYYATEGETDHACGWRVGRTDRGTTKIEHGGAVAGFFSQYSRFPEDRGLVIVVLTGERSHPAMIERVILDTIFAPTAVTAHLDWSPYEMGEHRSVSHSAWKTTWKAGRADDGFVTLGLRDPDDDHEIASIRVPLPLAQKLTAELETLIANKRDDGAAPQVDMGLYLVNHRTAGTELSLDEGLEVKLLPRYRGVGKDGTPVVDDRICLVLMDQEHRSWPILCKLNPAAAKAMHASMVAATR